VDSNKPDPNESDADLQEVAPEVSALREVSVRRKWLLVSRGLLRAAGTATLMVALYYVLPLDQRSHTFLFFEFACGIMLLIAIVSWQVRAIVRAKYPGIRATQALATAVPLFLLVFAATYFVLSFDDPATFSEPLSRSDALYFTVTVFATVGFGDINPQTEMVRLFVAVQMLLDLVVLGLGIQVILGAAQRGREN